MCFHYNIILSSIKYFKSIDITIDTILRVIYKNSWMKRPFDFITLIDRMVTDHSGQVKTVDRLSLLYTILLVRWIVIQFKFKYRQMHFVLPDRQLGIVFNERTARDDRYIYFYFFFARHVDVMFIVEHCAQWQGSTDFLFSL